MKKKVFLTGVAAAAAVASLTLVSCGGGNTPTQTTTGGTPTTTAPAENAVDVFLNYKNTSGITFQKIGGNTTHTNPIDNITYKANDLLPVWKTYQTNLNLKLRDASTYNEGADDNSTYKHFNDAPTGWVSSTDASQKIDLFYNSTANINKMGSEGKAVNLKDYIDANKMPNFKQYLTEHPEIKKEIQYGDNGAIYFTPYLDGYNAIERMIVMDTHSVELLLDADLSTLPATLGQLAAGTTAAATSKGLKGAPQFTPFIDANYNYPDATTTVKIDTGAPAATDLVIKQTANIIKQQNESLTAGTTGRALIQQMQEYLDAAFEGKIGDGKTYAKRSEIFTSGKAAYNTDELIALMRVFKANPDVLFYDVTGDAASAVENCVEVQGWFPRGEDNSRIQNLLMFAGEIFGVQGMGAEKDHLYFTADGKMHDAETTAASYDMLENLNDLYQEGLLLKDFWAEGAKGGKTYVNKYFAHTTDGQSSFGLLMHDYTATQSAPNDLDGGLGTKPANRKKTSTGINFANYSVKGIRPVLSPLTYWASTSSWSQSQSLFAGESNVVNKTGKTLNRYYEENRAVKGNSWCIPSTSDNVEGAIKLMDYLFSEEGNRIHNFGPSTYWDLGTVLDEQWPILKTAVLSDYSETGGDIWDYFRGVIGSTQGVGHYRPTALDYQSTNKWAKDAYNALNHAVLSGAQLSSKCVSANYTWTSTVPVSCYPTLGTSITDLYAPVTKFWAQDKRSASANGWVVLVSDASKFEGGTVVTDGTNYSKSLAEVEGLFETKNHNYLYAMANSVGATIIPDEAKQQ
ncbi:MAG: hypothetical protein IJU60_04005 [Acholeplasmatales bacterium]|nr:hypothetical protein [Acholeplasmatales bacterium]